MPTMVHTNKHVLIVDDDAQVRRSLELLLSSDYKITCAETAAKAISDLKIIKPDLILLDMLMPDLDGIEAIRQIKDLDPQIPVVFLTGNANVTEAVMAMKLGAQDYLSKPFEIDKLKKVISNQINTEKVFNKSEVTKQSEFTSPAYLNIAKNLDVYAKTDASVLILGESGTGKEVIARKLFNQSKRRAKPFIAVNCGAITESLIESEFFGHEKGSFTGANRRHQGFFEQAQGGVIFLDEVGELSPAMQVKLLRVLQEREVKRVGGSDLIKIDVRVIAATNRNLSEMIKTGEFREDLFYRLNVVEINLPALRERKEDILILAQCFIDKYCKEYDVCPITFSNAAIERLMTYSWPGNIRQLENLICNLLITSQSRHVDASELPFAQQGNLEEGLASLDELNEELEKELILTALEKSDFVASKAAKLLGLSSSVLQSKMDKLGLSH